LTGGKAIERGLMSHCVSTTQLAARLGLTAEVCDPLRQVAANECIRDASQLHAYASSLSGPQFDGAKS
jgi:hypothetical protein